MTNEEYLNGLFQAHEITLEEYLKTQELPSVTIERIRKAIKERNNTQMTNEEYTNVAACYNALLPIVRKLSAKFAPETIETAMEKILNEGCININKIQMTDKEYEDYLYNMVVTGEMSLSEYLRIEEDIRWEDYQHEQWLKNKKAKENETNTEQS